VSLPPLLHAVVPAALGTVLLATCFDPLLAPRPVARGVALLLGRLGQAQRSSHGCGCLPSRGRATHLQLLLARPRETFLSQPLPRPQVPLETPLVFRGICPGLLEGIEPGLLLAFTLARLLAGLLTQGLELLLLALSLPFSIAPFLSSRLLLLEQAGHGSPTLLSPPAAARRPP
jgi:hypothetical protein